MLEPAVHLARREELHRRVAGPILLLGNGTRARNLPMNHVPFRQDSTFLYYIGYDGPDAAALIETSGTTLFVPIPNDDDELWHGPTPTPSDLANALGIEASADIRQLEAAVPSPIKTLAVADGTVNARVSALGVPLVYGSEHGDDRLVDAVIRHRRTKSDAELSEIRSLDQVLCTLDEQLGPKEA